MEQFNAPDVLPTTLSQYTNQTKQTERTKRRPKHARMQNTVSSHSDLTEPFQLHRKIPFLLLDD
jgi:hypothetical protein